MARRRRSHKRLSGDPRHAVCACFAAARAGSRKGGGGGRTKTETVDAVPVPGSRLLQLLAHAVVPVSERNATRSPQL